MASRAYWKGYLLLSPCPIAHFPAASERKRISFHQNRHRPSHQEPIYTRASASQASCARTEGQLR
jgi:non-homologous end joining protein Ku